MTKFNDEILSDAFKNPDNICVSPKKRRFDKAFSLDDRKFISNMLILAASESKSITREEQERALELSASLFAEIDNTATGHQLALDDYGPEIVISAGNKLAETSPEKPIPITDILNELAGISYVSIATAKRWGDKRARQDEQFRKHWESFEQRGPGRPTG